METPVSTQWIDQYLGISDIDNPSFEEVRNFMILWNLFESLLFQGSYSNLKAIHKSQSLQSIKFKLTIATFFNFVTNGSDSIMKKEEVTTFIRIVYGFLDLFIYGIVNA